MAKYNGKKVGAVVRTAIVNLDLIYPVGSVYVSVVNTNPHNLFGGTWQSLNKDNPLYLLKEETKKLSNNNGYIYVRHEASGGAGKNIVLSAANTLGVSGITNSDLKFKTDNKEFPMYLDLSSDIQVYMWKRTA